MSPPTEPPWTGLGNLQHEVSSLREALHRKADDHEIYGLRSRIDHLEQALREARAKTEHLEYRLYQAESRLRQVTNG